MVPATLRTTMVTGFVGHDGKEPTAERGHLGPVLAEAAVGLHESLLGDVVGVRRRTTDDLGEAEGSPLVGANQ